jgi:hypothetical protein
MVWGVQNLQWVEMPFHRRQKCWSLLWPACYGHNAAGRPYLVGLSKAGCIACRAGQHSPQSASLMHTDKLSSHMLCRCLSSNCDDVEFCCAAAIVVCTQVNGANVLLLELCSLSTEYSCAATYLRGYGCLCPVVLGRRAAVRGHVTNLFAADNHGHHQPLLCTTTNVGPPRSHSQPTSFPSPLHTST